MPDSNLSRKLNFVNRSIGSKVMNFAADEGAKALFSIWANGVNFEPMDRFTKFNFLDRLESVTEHFKPMNIEFDWLSICN